MPLQWARCIPITPSLLTLMCAAIVACASSPPPLVAEGIRCEAGIVSAGHPAAPTLIVFAGWTVAPDDAMHWARALLATAFSRDRPAHVCVARGPQDASYQRRDIDTGAFARALLASPSHGTVTVVAHSAGSYVAQQFFRQLRAAGGAALLARIHYVNLDGAVGDGETAIDAELIQTLASVRAVYAIDQTTLSESANASSMRRLHALAPERVRLIALPVAHAGCHAGAKWCLHNALINRKPYNPASFDLKRDYGEINAAHPVEASYLRAEN